MDEDVTNLTSLYSGDPCDFCRGYTHSTATCYTKACHEEEQALVANIHDGSPEPKSLYEDKQRKDWTQWWNAMKIEFKNMEEKKVWDIIEKKDVPTGRKIIGNRWVYAMKDDGRFRARTVAKGFSQIAGKDFHENFAPVVKDATFHLILVLKALMNLEAGQCEIETALLYGDLDEKNDADIFTKKKFSTNTPIKM